MAKARHLPNAPLTEVVFEMRWALEGGEGTPPPFRQDPGYTVLAHTFKDAAKNAGFSVVKDMSPNSPPIAHSVGFRFFVDPDKAFPIWQIGPGIFAANQSAEYDWSNFRKLVLKGASTLIKTYPKIRGHSLRLVHCELRYIDSFAKELVGTLDFVKFVNKVTNWSVEIPEFLVNDKSIGRMSAGRILYQFRVRNMDNTMFHFNFGSSQKDEKPSFALESKVITTGNSIISSARADVFIRRLGVWLEDAHNLTSPFFASFVRKEILEKFK